MSVSLKFGLGQRDSRSFIHHFLKCTSGLQADLHRSRSHLGVTAYSRQKQKRKGNCKMGGSQCRNRGIYEVSADDKVERWSPLEALGCHREPEDDGRLRRIKPNTYVGPTLNLSIFHLGNRALSTYMQPSGSTRARILCQIAGSSRIATIPKTRLHQLKTISAEGDL